MSREIRRKDRYLRGGAQRRRRAPAPAPLGRRDHRGLRVRVPNTASIPVLQARGLAPQLGRRNLTDRRRGALAGLAFLLIVGASIFLSVIAMDHSDVHQATVNTASEFYIGTLVLEPIERKRCRRLMFDNLTGRLREISEIAEGCAELIDLPIDQKGLVKPIGTIQRLNAISHSFSAR